MLHLQAWQRQLLLPQDVGFAQLHKHFSLTKHLPGSLRFSYRSKRALRQKTLPETLQRVLDVKFFETHRRNTHIMCYVPLHYTTTHIGQHHISKNTVTGRSLYLVSCMGWQDGELEASRVRLCHPLAS